MYKINEDYDIEYKKLEAHQFHSQYLELAMLLMDNSASLYINFNRITHEFLRIIKPKRVIYNSENKWYADDICTETMKYVHQVSKSFVPNIEPHDFSKCFGGLRNLMKIFMVVSDDGGHEFFSGVILQFFGDNQEMVSSDILSLFSEMIHYESSNRNQVMINVMNQVIENNNETRYFDTYPALFLLMNDFAKIDLQNISTFCDYYLKNRMMKVFLKMPKSLVHCFCCHYLMLIMKTNSPSLLIVYTFSRFLRKS